MPVWLFKLPWTVVIYCYWTGKDWISCKESSGYCRPPILRKMKCQGMDIGYYIIFIPQFATIAAPLTTWLRTVVAWNKQFQSNFNKLKTFIREEPILAVANWPTVIQMTGWCFPISTRRMELDCKYGCKYPVGYTRRKLSPRKSVIEHITIVWAIKFIDAYFMARNLAQRLTTSHRPSYRMRSCNV